MTGKAERREECTPKESDNNAVQQAFDEHDCDGFLQANGIIE